MTKRIVGPGTPLAYSEELLPGEGTYDDGEHIRAAVYGTENVNSDTMAVSIEPVGRGVTMIEKDDIVVGRVGFVKEQLASVQILAIRGKEGSLLQRVEGTLHVSKIDNRFIKDVAEEFQVGDIIRAKVIGLKGGPQLVTDKPEFGVIKAFSRNDPTQMLVRKGSVLEDSEDGHREKRKIAEDYGSGTI